MKQTIKLGKETDWFTSIKGRRLYAVHRDTRLFENTSNTERMTMELYSDTDENDVANALGNFLWNGHDYEYALYDTQHRLVGWVYYED